MGYGFDWAWSGLGLVFIALCWKGLRILEPTTNIGMGLSAPVPRQSNRRPAGLTCRRPAHPAREQPLDQTGPVSV